jgi:tripartite-type tricarboxylate transporter receptor subunit TctC
MGVKPSISENKPPGEMRTMDTKESSRLLGRGFAAAFVTLGVGVAAAPSAAQDYPAKPVTLVVPYGPGGGVDTIGRAVADGLAKQWNTSVVVENKPGAGSNIGASYVANQAPDGYTLLVATDESLFINEFVYKDLPYSPQSDFDPVTQLINVHSILVAAPSLGVDNLQEFIEKMKAEGANYNYGSPGVGDSSHLGMEWLKNDAGGFEMKHIPYTGMAPAVQGMLSGDHQALIVSVLTAKQHIDAGKMVPIAVSGKARAPSLPDVPTFAEQGFPEISLGFSVGLVAPKGTPLEIREKIADAARIAFNEPEFQKKYVEAFGYEVIASSPEEFADFLKEGRENAERLVKLAGAENLQ